MKKKLFVLFLALSLVFVFAGCGSNGEQGKEEEKQPNIEVVSQTISEHDNGFWKTIFTVKNNTSEPINTISLVINELDANGNIIGTTYPQDPSVVQPGQTINLNALHKDSTGIVSVKATSVNYTAGEEHLTNETIDSNFKQENLKNTEPLLLQ